MSTCYATTFVTIRRGIEPFQGFSGGAGVRQSAVCSNYLSASPKMWLGTNLIYSLVCPSCPSIFGVLGCSNQVGNNHRYQTTNPSYPGYNSGKHIGCVFCGLPLFLFPFSFSTLLLCYRGGSTKKAFKPFPRKNTLIMPCLPSGVEHTLPLSKVRNGGHEGSCWDSDKNRRAATLIAQDKPHDQRWLPWQPEARTKTCGPYTGGLVFVPYPK